MDTALEILKRLADGRPEPSLGSEYMDASRYLKRPRERIAKPPPHGANESDFGSDRLRALD